MFKPYFKIEQNSFCKLNTEITFHFLFLCYRTSVLDGYVENLFSNINGTFSFHCKQENVVSSINYNLIRAEIGQKQNRIPGFV